MSTSRDDTIKTIRAELKRRSGKTWSVTGGTGTVQAAQVRKDLFGVEVSA